MSYALWVLRLHSWHSTFSGSAGSQSDIDSNSGIIGDGGGVDEVEVREVGDGGRCGGVSSDDGVSEDGASGGDVNIGMH